MGSEAVVKRAFRHLTTEHLSKVQPKEVLHQQQSISNPVKLNMRPKILEDLALNSQKTHWAKTLKFKASLTSKIRNFLLTVKVEHQKPLYKRWKSWVAKENECCNKHPASVGPEANRKKQQRFHHHKNKEKLNYNKNMTEEEKKWTQDLTKN